MRDAVSEEGRILSIFEKEGVIKLKPGIDKVTARISDIVENPKSCNSPLTLRHLCYRRCTTTTKVLRW